MRKNIKRTEEFTVTGGGNRRSTAKLAVFDGSRLDAEESNADPWIDPGAHGENLGVFQSPTYTLGRLAGIIRRSFMTDYVESVDLSIPEWRVLAAVAEYSSLSFNEICGALTMDRAQVSRTLGTLLPKGYVAQLTTARTQRRGRGHNATQTRVILTPKGQEIYQQILPIAQEHQMILLGALDTKEREVLHTVLRKMIQAAEQFEAKRALEAPTKTKRRAKSTSKRKNAGTRGRKAT